MVMNYNLSVKNRQRSLHPYWEVGTLPCSLLYSLSFPLYTCTEYIAHVFPIDTLLYFNAKVDEAPGSRGVVPHWPVAIPEDSG